MKIIFLDIDGVLNSDLWEKSSNHKANNYPFNQFDPKAIKLFNKVVNETKAKIVLSSTWRLNHSLPEMKDIFKSVGIVCDIIAFTPDLKTNNDAIIRGNEILKWCKENEETIGCKHLHYTDFAILDDNDDMLLWQNNYFFQTDRLCGLSPTVAKKIIRYFNK